MKTIKVKVRQEVVETWEYEVQVDDSFPDTFGENAQLSGDPRCSNLDNLFDKISYVDGNLLDSQVIESDITDWEKA